MVTKEEALPSPETFEPNPAKVRKCDAHRDRGAQRLSLNVTHYEHKR